MSKSTHKDNYVSPNLTQRGAYLCYINGLKVPIVGAMVQSGVGQLPRAQIYMYPSTKLIRFGAEDRVTVALFYLDNHYTPGDPTYRLLFDGDVEGWEYSSSGDSRSLILNAVCTLQALDQVQYRFLNAYENATFGIQGGNTAGATSQVGVHFPYSLFHKGFMFNSSDKVEGVDIPDPTITKPSEILTNAIDAILSNSGTGKKTIPSMNFLRRWASDRVVGRRTVATTFDDVGDDGHVFPLIKAAKTTAALPQLQSSLAVNSSGSLLQIIREAYQAVYFELSVITTPPAVVAGADLIPTSLHSASTKSQVTLAAYHVKPQALFAVPPMCNVLFPSVVRSVNYSENYSVQPTRAYMLDGYMQSVADAGAFSNPYTTGYPEVVDSAMRAKRSKSGSAAENPTGTETNFLIWPEEFFRGPVVYRAQTPVIYGALARQAEEDADESSAEDAEADATEFAEKTESKRLAKLYAKYEYFRSRYSERGGSADLVFNPYVIPGYPCVLFDKPGGVDQVGYVNTVVHSLSPTGMTTSINYFSGRTLPEWSATWGSGYVSGPTDPIPDNSEKLQTINGATRYYTRLLFGGAAPGKAVAFNLQDVSVNGRATDNYAKLFTNTNDALSHTSRPVCSLTQYAQMMNNVTEFSKLPDAVRSGMSYDYGARVFKRIYSRNAGTTPTAKQLGYSTAKDGSVTMGYEHQQYSALQATSRDWDEALKAYIEEVEGLVPAE